MRTKPHQGTLSVRDNYSISSSKHMSTPTRGKDKFLRFFVVFLIIFRMIKNNCYPKII